MVISRIINWDTLETNGVFAVQNNNWTYAIYDNSMKLLVSDIKYPIKEALQKSYIAEVKEKKFILFNFNHKPLTKEFDYIINFSWRKTSFAKLNEKGVLIDQEGKIVIDNLSKDRIPFFKDNRIVLKKDNGKYMLTWFDWNIILDEYYFLNDIVSDGFLSFKKDKNNAWWIDVNWKILLEGFKNTLNFFNGFAIFIDKDDKKGYIDLKGRIITSGQDFIQTYKYGYALINKDEENFYLIDKDSNILFGADDYFQVKIKDTNSWHKVYVEHNYEKYFIDLITRKAVKVKDYE